MAQSLLDVLRSWQSTTGTALSAEHRRAFTLRPEAADLAALPRLVVEAAAAAVFRESGELRMATWLAEAHEQRRHDPPLKVELVPSTCWWSNLRSELSPEQWAVCKRWSGRRAGWRCAVCGERGPRWPVECHEQWLYDDALPRLQRLGGLISLCPACHESTHMGFASINGRDVEAAVHLAEVNGWDSGQVDTYLDACWAQWEDRSAHQWQLDVRWLTDVLGIDVPPVERPTPGTRA